MLENGNEALGEGSAERPSGSVCDFLYCDERRVGAFLSQFDDLGVPTRVSVSESVQKARGRSFKISAGGGVAGVGNANISLERGPAAVGGTKAEQRDYDPFWTNALALLDYLQTNELLCRDIATSRIGQFVLVTGRLSLFDVGMIQTAWGIKQLEMAFADNIKLQTPTANRKQKEKSSTHISLTLRAMVELTRAAPRTTITIIEAVNGLVWSSLQTTGLITPADEIALKHGIGLAGEWRMVGLMDALPEPDDKPREFRSSAASPLGTLGNVAGSLGHALRGILGRPYEAHGMTPLVIFREIIV